MSLQSIAAIPGNQEPQLINPIDPRKPQADEVVCETVYLGVCGTDREILHAATPHVPHGAQQLVLGHECLARVLEVGQDVEQVKPGDLVVPAVRRPTSGATTVGIDEFKMNRRPDMMPWGAYVERGIVWEHGFSLPQWIDRPEFLYQVPDSIKQVAILSEPISVSEKAVREAQQAQAARLGEKEWVDHPPRVLITGMGPIAFAAVICCRARGWEVTVFGRDAEDTFRAGLVRDFDAKYVNADTLSFTPESVEQDGFELILECTGSDRVMMQSAGLLAGCGIMVWLGASRLPQVRDFDVNQIMRNAILGNHLYIGTVNNAPQDMQSAINHLAGLNQQYGETIARMITEQVVPADSLWHYTNRTPQGIKTIVRYAGFS
ncbi:MAG: hypothetical protein CMJ76_01305 [Planctomycetaceae bacterium]|nr:hypothetical protein [Planctomycetaceae bacterium]|tara:strand:+ start:4080 stop:5207 length:1128 start_codon:yes stop_codon:yes gene_type:complete